MLSNLISRRLVKKMLSNLNGTQCIGKEDAK